MGMCDMIADFIGELLREDGGTAELQRSELASRFGCAPSQINYVLSTRFPPELGYAVESRRGGGGYIRIRHVQPGPQLFMMHTLNAVGQEIDARSAQALLGNAVDCGALGEKAARLMFSAVSDTALRPVEPEARDAARASILKQMILELL